jgi:hypothetical protein
MRKKTYKQCQRCSKGGLHWEQVRINDNRKGWRLYNSHGELHICNPAAVMAQQNRGSADSIGDPELNENLEPLPDSFALAVAECAAQYSDEYEQWASEQAHSETP